MENLEYISVYTRETILQSYIVREKLTDSGASRELLERKLFGSPFLRRVIDAGIKRANKEVDLERYSQWSQAWCQEVIHDLPPFNALGDFIDLPVLEDKRTKKSVQDYIKDPKGYEQYRDKVDDIILNFDFEKVHKIMKTLNWTWASWKDEYETNHISEVPSVYALKQQAYHLLRDAVEKGLGGTGGFSIQCYVYDEAGQDEDPDDFGHSVHLSISFVVESQGDIC